MSNQFFGISPQNDHVELYFIEWGVSSGFQGWFNQDIMASLASCPEHLVVGIERGELSEAWASHFQRYGHSVYVVPPKVHEGECVAGPESRARSICHAAVLLHSEEAASC